MMITDEAGRQLAVTDLNGAELRALRVLASAGMIPPHVTRAPRAPRTATLKQPRQETRTARPAAKAS